MTTEMTHQDQQTTVRPPEAVERASDRPIVRPNVAIIDSDTEILLNAEMPGVDENHADVTLERNVLTIRGTTEPGQLDGFELVHSEYPAADYERSFTLSDEINRDGIEASVNQGVLQLRLPKIKEAQTRKISIKAG